MPRNDERTTVNAKITRTEITIEDHGILSFWVHLEWEGGGQGLGGYALDAHDPKLKYRPGWGLGLTCIRKIIETVGVNSWEQLKGSLIRAKIGTLGSSEAPIIGNILKNEWFDLDTFVKENK